MNEELMHKRFRRMIRTVVGIGVMLFAAGILFAAFLLDTMRDAAREQMRAETEEYNNRLYRQLDADYQILDTFASIIGEAELMSEDGFPEMLDQANYQNDFLTMIYADASGWVAAATLDKDVVNDITLDDLQPEARAVLEDALKGERSISQMFEGSFSNEAVFVYGTPVYKDGRITGAIAASDKVEIFHDILDGDTVLGGYGYINMIDMDGNYIVHSEKDKIGRELDNVFTEPYFTDAQEAEAAKEELQEKGSLVFSFRYGGEKYEALIQMLGINNWCLLSISNVQTSSKEVYVLVRIIGIVFGCILLLVLFLLAYGCRLMRRNSRELREIAYRDSLTGALNLIRFRQLVEEKIQKDRNYSIISLNIHQFKFINEIFGQEQADRILRLVKDKIGQNIHGDEFFCRESADIFYIFSKETDKEIIHGRVKKIMDDVTDTRDEGHGDYQILMYCGAAVATEVENEYSLDEMMTHVMVALSRARQIHQNNIWFFDKDLHRKEMMDNYVESHMNQALRDKEFKLYLQPKVDLESGEVKSAEALVRWVKADGSIIYPVQFVHLFEMNGFCIQLDMYMVETVCWQIRRWIDAGIKPVSVSVNQSKRVLYEKDYLAKLTAIVEKYHVPAQLITLEILEGLALENVDELNRKIEELQQRGFRVSLDDFGSEYSSLNTLGQIRLNELKLDRWFLKDIAEGKNSHVQLIMEQIIQLARKLHISTVVEGVETEEDHRLIRELKCDYGQGFYYSRPISAEDFTDKYLKAGAERMRNRQERRET